MLSRTDFSFKNIKEAEAVILLARHLEEENKSFRIITPYDGQRSLIELELKNNGLGWENKCFNVDSFQGQVVWK